MPQLTAAAEAFDRHLDRETRRPIAVACSGGGDSVAALLAAKAWADRCGRRVVVLHVDHGLQSPSRDWRDFVADLARRLDCDFQGLTWDGVKPVQGLAAAARCARHGLIAEAARAAGARVVIFGHTEDDRLEATLMRAEGSTLGRLAPWTPSPVWPAGRGLFLLRPLLGVRRAEIRRALTSAGERWIEDPANEDPRSARARARRAMAAGAPACASPQPDGDGGAALARAAEVGPCGIIRIDRAALRAAPSPAARRFVSAAALCAGGGERPPRRARVLALFERLRGEGDVAATLAGAQVAAGEAVVFARNAGETARGGLAPLRLTPGATGVWDGRFELTAGAAPLQIAALKGRFGALPDAERAALRQVPAPARAGLPIAAPPSGRAACPVLARDGGIQVRFLGGERLLAACGAILKEPGD